MPTLFVSGDGNTYRYRNELRSRGATWNRSRKRWEYDAPSMHEIETMAVWCHERGMNYSGAAEGMYDSALVFWLITYTHEVLSQPEGYLTPDEGSAVELALDRAERGCLLLDDATRKRLKAVLSGLVYRKSGLAPPSFTPPIDFSDIVYKARWINDILDKDLDHPLIRIDGRNG